MSVPVQERGIEWYETPAGEKRYRVRWREGKHQRSRSFTRLADARRFHTEVRAASETGKRLAIAGSEKLSLAEFVIDTWGPKAERRLSAKSWKTTKQIYNKHILPKLGARPLAELDAEDLVEYQDELEEAGVGNPTHLKILGILSSIFKEAARRPRRTGVKTNPVALLEKPSAKRRARARVWSPEIIEKVRYELLTNPEHNPNSDQKRLALRDATLVSLAYLTGARPGEILALKVESIGSSDLSITSVISDGVPVDKTKTGKDRLIPITPALRQDLAAYIAAWNLKKGDYLFSRPDGNPWTEADWNNWRRRHFNEALIRVDEPGLEGTRPYDLGRHSYAALQLASGQSLPSLAEKMGHSVRILSETYTATISEYKEKPTVDAEKEIDKARKKIFQKKDPSTGL